MVTPGPMGSGNKRNKFQIGIVPALSKITNHSVGQEVLWSLPHHPLFFILFRSCLKLSTFLLCMLPFKLCSPSMPLAAPQVRDPGIHSFSDFRGSRDKLGFCTVFCPEESKGKYRGIVMCCTHD